MNKTTKIIIGVLLVVVALLWVKTNKINSELLKEKLKYKTEIIKNDSLQKINEGHYRKLVADTLTRKQLKDLIADVTELKNRKPISLTTTIIKPVEIRKETDQISVEKDSVFIEDYYPNKETSFLKYTNRFSLSTQKGLSNFSFNEITLKQVVTKKENGLYQVDFKGPDFLELKSLDIQTEPMSEPVKDNWGTLIGVEYGQNLENKTNIFEVNLYQRYKKIYVGASVSTNKDLKGGIKIEL